MLWGWAAAQNALHCYKGSNLGDVSELTVELKRSFVGVSGNQARQQLLNMYGAQIAVSIGAHRHGALGSLSLSDDAHHRHFVRLSSTDGLAHRQACVVEAETGSLRVMKLVQAIDTAWACMVSVR